jgi:polar amino acid transport system substrate-binding protein
MVDIRKTVLLRLIAGLVLALAGAGVLADKLIIYGDDAYAPVIYAKQGQVAGILPALFARLAKSTGDSYELVLLPWKRALREAERGQGGITNLSWNQERAKLFDFSDPIYDDDIQLVVLKGRAFAFADLSDLQGKTLGGLSGASYGEVVDKAIAAGLIRVERDPSQVSRLKKLLLGRMDAAIVGNGMAGLDTLLSADEQLSANRDKFSVLPQPLVRDPLYLAFAKSMQMKPALERFNKALAALKSSDEYRQLVETAR